MVKKVIVFVLIFFAFCFSNAPCFAQEEILEGKVINVSEEKENYQKLEVLITKGSRKEQKVEVEVGGKFAKIGQPKYQIGNTVLVSFSKNLAGEDVFYITEFVRRRPLFWLFLIFVIFTVVVGRWRGLSSLLGLFFSFFIILKFVFPQILAGNDPIFIAILGSLVIIPVTFYLSHGINKKTTVAIVGTFISLTFVGILAKVFVEAARLTGFSSEQAAFLQIAQEGSLNIKGLLLAGIIIGTLGILDDITVAQSAIVSELRSANPKLSTGELFSRAMKVGQDHIASMVNTLILVYTGASLPLLLLFINNPQPFAEVINYEIIAEEIVRTLVGSIGLILAVPATTLLASSFNANKGEL